MKKIVILGSTGSIGTQTLDVIREYPDEFKVIGLSGHKNAKLLKQQVREFQPKHVIRTFDSETLQQLAALPEADIIVNAIAGYAGLMSTIEACKAGKKIALANKESIAMAGELIMDLARKYGAEILPIDSEPSAVWQCLSLSLRAGSESEAISKIILTASGGPFFGWQREKLNKVTPAQALNHPTWKMGKKVSIDSATLMNKAFEIIETRWLFDMPPSKIDVTIHRQSIVHALVQFCDGNTTAILSQPDMRIPIANALFYPRRSNKRPPKSTQLDFSKLQLTFEKPDYSILEGPKLAYEVLDAGGIMPAVFCLADEIAVDKFLRGEISFLQIYEYIKRTLGRIRNEKISAESIEELTGRLIHNA